MSLHLIFFSPSQLTVLQINLPHIMLISYSLIIMNYLPSQDCPSNSRNYDRFRRFNRSQDRDSVSAGKRPVSQCGSENSLFRYYKAGANLIKNPKFMQDFIRSISPACQKDDIEVVARKKPKTLTQKFTVDRQNQLDTQKQQLKAEILRLKNKNKQLQCEVASLKANNQNSFNKENKPMNKMRQKTHKQRIKELEGEISQLKSTIVQLNEQIREAKTSRLTQQTNISSADCNFELEEQHESNQKQIFVLNEEIKKLQIQMDFMNRRNYAQIYTLRAAHEKQIKLQKDKIQELTKVNSELNKKNTDLIYKIKGTRERKTCQCDRGQQKQDLLELSCSD